MNPVCVECGRGGLLVPVDDVCICLDCVRDLLEGCIPEHISRGGPRPVYWWFCVCGLEVRRGPFVVDPAELPVSKGEVLRIARYQRQVEGVPSGGVMLCQICAAVAGVPLPAPAPALLPANVIDLAELRRGRPRPRERLPVH